MPVIILPLLFLAAGLIGVVYYQAIPTQAELRRRLPNRISWAGIALTVIVGIGVWLIVRKASTTFLKISGVTTLLFYLLTFETFLLLMFRWAKSNLFGVLAAAGLTAIPFAIQFMHPTYTLSNALIIIATLGATALVIRLEVLRTRIIIVMAALLTVNDVLNVTYVLPKLPLTPPAQTPLPLLIFPTVNIAGHVVGSGDFMFLALTTLVLVKDFGPRVANWYVIAQAVALTITLSIIIHRDILIPYLVVMTPIFFVTYIVARQKKKVLAKA